MTSTAHSATTLGAAGNPVAPVEHAVGGAAAPVLDPVAGTTHPVAEAAGGLTQPAAAAADPVVSATAPVLDPVAGTTHPIAEAAGGLAQHVTGIADPVTEPITSNLASHLTAADLYLRGAGTGFDSGAGLSPHEAAVGGDPGGIGGVLGSFLDSVADGRLSPPAGTAHYASVVALVAALGFTASRFGNAASGLAGSTGGGIRSGVRLAWLASWNASRCVLATASGLVGTSPTMLASATSAGVSGFAASQSAPGGASAARVGETVRSLFGQIPALAKPEGSPLSGLMGRAWSFGRLLRGLLLLAGGLLGFAVFPLRHRGQVMVESPVRVSLAVMGISILLAVGVVVLLAA